ncbi:MAG: chromate transporter [Rikenellaceae bacterium]|nr:chromate transporter [Rikenellaceae bacterium]
MNTRYPFRRPVRRATESGSGTPAPAQPDNRPAAAGPGTEARGGSTGTDLAATADTGGTPPTAQDSSYGAIFWTFFKIGLFTFGGGYAMIPLIEREIIDRRGWIEKQNFLELLTVAQSAPGPIALNTSVFVGYKIRGVRGATSAILGAITPSFFIILAVAMFFASIKDNRYVEAAFKGMRPAVVALIAAPIYNLAKGLGWWRILIAAVAAFIVWYFSVSPIYMIIIGAVAGLTYSFIRK